MAIRYTDRDRGWRRLIKQIQSAKGGPLAVVGIFGEKAAADHDGRPNVEIAAAHEFGLTIAHPGGTAYVPGGRFVSNAAAEGRNLPRTAPHDIVLPERSFIRATVDIKLKEIALQAKTLGGAVLDGAVTVEKGLETLGLFVKGLIQQRIADGIPPPLKDATIARKGSSKPLISTGQLRASIDTEVRRP